MVRLAPMLTFDVHLLDHFQERLKLASVQPDPPAFWAEVDLHVISGDFLHSFIAVGAHQ